MATTKSKAAKKPLKATKSAQRGLVTSRFKFNKITVLGLAAALSVAGAIFVFSSHAAEAPIHGYDWRPPTGHTGGEKVGIYVYWVTGGTTVFNGYRGLWFSSGAPVGHYIWWGHYNTINIASGSGHGITACWWYMTNGTTSMSTVFDVSQNYGQVVQSFTDKLGATKGLLHQGNAYKEVRPICHNVALSSGTHSAVELRVQQSTSTINNLWIYKTTWQQY